MEQKTNPIEEYRKRLTVVVCAYKANKAFTLCLHQLARYGMKAENLLIYENSPSDYVSNRELLRKYKIDFIDNPGGLHADTFNMAFKEIKTDYALLLDSDCFCTFNPVAFLPNIEKHGVSLFGDICGNRGGFRIRKRVHPWWCIVDMKLIREAGIQFVDMERMVKTNSMSLIKRELLGKQRDMNGYYYDAGSTMMEDVLKAGGIAADVGETLPYIHIEGSSWKHDFPEYEASAVKNDNWVNLLYGKLQFEEKYLANLGRKANG